MRQYFDILSHCKPQAGPLDTPCMIWQGYIQHGYGVIRVRGRLYKAHRHSFENVHGMLAKGLYCLHRCDVRACCNPDHLYAGTYRDNARDREQRKRGRRPDNKGERHGLSKLTWTQVDEIRRAYEAGTHKQRDLATQYCVSQSSVSLIVRRKLWTKGDSKCTKA